MIHYPVQTFEEKERFTLRQQLTLDDEQDYIEAVLSKDQAVQVATALMKWAGKKVTAAVGGGTADCFDEWWSAYPANSKRRVNKQGCLTIWRRRNLDAIADQIIAHTRHEATDIDWLKENGAFVPMATTYLNQSRWEATNDAPMLFQGNSV